MNQKKKLIISIISVLAVVLIVAGVTYAIFAITTNFGIVAGNSGKLDVNYTISSANVTGMMMPSASRDNNLKETVTAKLNSGSVDGALNIYLTPTTITGLPKEAINWEVDVMDGSNLIDHYSGNLSSATVNSPITIVESYLLDTTTLTFNIYIWLNGVQITNSNFSDTNSFVATISADTVPVTGRFDLYTVTFDPNGGSVSPTSKKVDPGLRYGSLPTPTRAGYTFLGWNGKNLINMEDCNVILNNQYYRDAKSVPAYVFTASTGYTLSFNYVVNSSSRNVYATVGYGATGFSRDIKSSGNYSGSGTVQISFTTPDTFNYDPPYAWFRFVRMSQAGNANVDISNIQLEKGNTATAYEPYYVTSSTIVTQEKNHTLTAIWEPTS